MNVINMNHIIKSDLYRYDGKSGFVDFLKAFIQEPGFRFSYFLRKASLCAKNSPFYLVNKFFHRHYKFKYGYQIPVNTQIGEGLFIGHVGFIVINVNSKIGRNCNIGHGVTIGQTNRGKRKGCPVIGDEVWIGAGAVIVGNIEIGNNVLIAPNSFVNEDVPANSVVIGNPAKVLFNSEATEGYLNYKV